jgi:Helitron helicase-like domain at N-terminus
MEVDRDGLAESIVELHCCGVVDTVGTSLPMEPKFHQALQAIYIPHVTADHSSLPIEFPSHLYKEPASFLSKDHGQDNLWEIRFNNRTYANEYDPQHLPSAFPSLFPFGVGGVEDPLRPVALRSMDKHLRVLLMQSHEAFARHEIFIFVAFNVLQRRQICLGSKLVASHRLLPEVCELLRHLNYDEVCKALEGIKPTSRRLPSTVDPRITKLMELTAIASTGCRGSVEYFQQRRTEIRALFVRFGGPHFFVTVNPDDSKHPLVLSFSPSTLNATDQQSFVVSIPRASRLRNQRRYKLIAQNPVIQAQFFDKVFTAVVTHLLGFGREDRVGILGKVSSYYALIEAQGKGTLHAHTLVWLSDGNSYHHLISLRQF